MTEDLIVLQDTQQELFDFSIVPEDNRERAIMLDRELGTAIQRLSYTVGEIGLICTEMKSILPHGLFGKWHESRGLTHNQVEYAMKKVIGHARFSTPIEEVSNNHEIQDYAPPDIEGVHKLLELPKPRVETLATQVERGEMPIREALTRIQYQPDIAYTTGSIGLSTNDKHNTPQHIVQAVIECLDGLDLDPCTNSKTEPNVPAAHYYDEDDDGLSQDWFGKIYINPPYGQPIEKWVEKTLSEYKAGWVTEAILLVPARLDTQWYRLLDEFYRCEIRGRLVFGDAENNAPFSSMLFYIGKQPWKLAQVFGKYGRIMVCADELNMVASLLHAFKTDI